MAAVVLCSIGTCKIGGGVRHETNGNVTIARWVAFWRTPLGPPPRAGDALAWVAVWLTAGVFLFFTFPAWFSPGVAGAGAAAGAALLGMHVWLRRRGRAAHMLLPAALMLLGVALAAVRVAMPDTLLLPAHAGGVELHGVVERVTPHRPGQARMVVLVRHMSRVKRRHWPQRARLTITGLPHGSAAYADLPLPGDAVLLRARLLRLPQPVAPGAWDPARDLYMTGIGAVGYAHVKGLEVISADCGDCALSLRLARWLEQLRRGIAGFISARMTDGRAVALAQALTIGARGVLPAEVREQLRAAGLAHILAISGLHLALLAGAVFWLVRAGLALFPPLALRWPLKKIAAVAAWLAALAYLLLSGNSVATQRAFIMLSVALLALLAERPAISMRNLAVAALLILLLWPHKALSAGFQMSFLAVMGLVATYETLSWWRAQRGNEPHVPRGMMMRALRRLLGGVAALALTTIVASAFTSLPAVWHFHRLPVHGLLGNLVALPLLSLVVMPAALLALVLAPAGLAGWPLRAMEQGLSAILQVAEVIARLPGGWWHVPALSASAALLLAGGLLWLALRNDRLRLAGLLPIVLVISGLWPAFAPRPLVLVEDRARLVAVRQGGEPGRLAATPGRAGDFVLRIWLRRDGDAATPKQARRRKGWACDAMVCRARLPGQGRVAYLRDVMRGRELSEDRLLELADAMRRACAGAQVIIAAFPLRGMCGALPERLVIDRFDVWRHGAHAVMATADGGLRIIRVDDGLHGLPWARSPLPRREVLLRGKHAKESAE